MSQLGPVRIALLGALLVVGCGIPGNSELRPIGAVTVAKRTDSAQPAPPWEGIDREQEELGGAVFPGAGSAQKSLRERQPQADTSLRRDRVSPARIRQGRGGKRESAMIPMPAQPSAPLAATSQESLSLMADEGDAQAVTASEPTTAAKLYRSYCGSCHSLDLVESQRLDRDNWDWVLDDMIEEYGARWITPKQREMLLDYLVENLGPEDERGR